MSRTQTLNCNTLNYEWTGIAATAVLCCHAKWSAWRIKWCPCTSINETKPRVLLTLLLAVTTPSGEALCNWKDASSCSNNSNVINQTKGALRRSLAQHYKPSSFRTERLHSELCYKIACDSTVQSPKHWITCSQYRAIHPFSHSLPRGIQEQN